MLLNRDRALAIMNQLGLDALVASSPENVLYASDYECSTHWINKGAQVYAALTPSASSSAFLVAPALELEAIIESGVWIDDVWLVGNFRRGPAPVETMDALGRQAFALARRAGTSGTAVEALVQALKYRGLERGRIGLDETGMTAQIWAEIAGGLPNATLVPAGNIWWKIRMVKTADEIQRLRRASEITERAINAAFRLAKPGVTEADIVREYHLQLAAHGARPTFSMFGSGSRTASPHIAESHKALMAGDLLRYDIGCTYRYYHSDTARATVIGKPTDLQRRIWDAMVAGEEAAIACVRPGAEPRDVHAAGMKPGLDAALADFSRFHCGHGVGVSVYDPPLMTAADPMRSIFLMPGVEHGLEEGMVINIEVGYYIQGVIGFLCEDTLLITATGRELLTHNSKSLRLDEYLAQAAV